MGKNQALWTLFDELNDITTTLEKANIASKCLNDIYFGVNIVGIIPKL